MEDKEYLSMTPEELMKIDDPAVRRKIAEEIGLLVAHKKDSQEICFMLYFTSHKTNYISQIKSRIKKICIIY